VENKKKNKKRSRTGCDKKESGVCTNDHSLSRFKSQYEAVCDGCGESRPPASELHGCRICNFDLCSQCHDSQIIKANEAAAAAAAAVGGNKSATTDASTDASVKETNADMMCDDVANDEAHAMQEDGGEESTTTTAALGSSCSSVMKGEEEQDEGKVTPTSNEEEGDDGTVSSSAVSDKVVDNDDLSSEPIMLVDCLQRFTAPEVLSDNGFACDGCLGEKRPASKQLTLSKLPNTLVVNVTT
jgi:hypothetical protein